MPGDLDADAQEGERVEFGSAVAAWLEDVKEAGRGEVCNRLGWNPAKPLAILRAEAKHRSKRHCPRQIFIGRGDVASRHPLQDRHCHPSPASWTQSHLARFLAPIQDFN